MSAKAPSWNPLRCDGTALPSGCLLAAKLLAGAFFPSNRFLLVGPPFLPLVPALGSAWVAPWLGMATAIAFYAAFLSLMFNRMVRTSCVVIGACILLHVAGHRLEYANSVLFPAMFLLLFGLHDPRTGLWPARVQFALVYGGASLNKALDVDWWNGRFFNALMNDLSVSWYLQLDPHLPDRWLGAFCGAAVITVEVSSAALVLLSRGGRLGVGLVIAFHAAMLALTDGRLSIPFFYSAVAIAAAFFTPMPALEARAPRWLTPVVASVIWWTAAMSIRFIPRWIRLLA